MTRIIIQVDEYLREEVEFSFWSIGLRAMHRYLPNLEVTQAAGEISHQHPEKGLAPRRRMCPKEGAFFLKCEGSQH